MIMKSAPKHIIFQDMLRAISQQAQAISHMADWIKITAYWMPAQNKKSAIICEKYVWK